MKSRPKGQPCWNHVGGPQPLAEALAASRRDCLAELEIR